MRFWFWNSLSRLDYQENFIFCLLIFHILFSVPHLVKTIYFCMIPLFCFAWICSRELLSPFDHFHFYTYFQLASDFILTVSHEDCRKEKFLRNSLWIRVSDFVCCVTLSSVPNNFPWRKPTGAFCGVILTSFRCPMEGANVELASKWPQMPQK